MKYKGIYYSVVYNIDKGRSARMFPIHQTLWEEDAMEVIIDLLHWSVEVIKLFYLFVLSVDRTLEDRSSKPFSIRISNPRARCSRQTQGEGRLPYNMRDRGLYFVVFSWSLHSKSGCLCLNSLVTQSSKPFRNDPESWPIFCLKRCMAIQRLRGQLL